MSAKTEPMAASVSALHDFEIVPLDSSTASLDDGGPVGKSFVDSKHTPIIKQEPHHGFSDDEDLSSVTSGLPCHADTDMSDVGEETFVNEEDDYDGRFKSDVDDDMHKLKKEPIDTNVLKDSFSRKHKSAGLGIDDSVQSDTTLRMPYSMIKESQAPIHGQLRASQHGPFSQLPSPVASRRMRLALQVLLAAATVLLTAAVCSDSILQAFYAWSGQSTQALAELQMYELAGPAIMLIGAAQIAYWNKLKLLDTKSQPVAFTISRPNEHSNDVAMLSWQDVAHTASKSVSKRGMRLIVGTGSETRTFDLGSDEKISPISRWQTKLQDVLKEVRHARPPIDVTNGLARYAKQVAEQTKAQWRKIKLPPAPKVDSMRARIKALYADQAELFGDIGRAADKEGRRMRAAVAASAKQANRGLSRLTAQCQEAKKRLSKMHFGAQYRPQFPW